VSEVEYIQFTPLRQALDERIQRRIRRNHLSEVVNSYEADKRIHAQLKKEIQEKQDELEKLKTKIEAAREAKTAPATSAADAASSQSKVAEIEEELEILRRSFHESQPSLQAEETWDHVTRNISGPNSEGGDTFLIHEDEIDPYDHQDDNVQRNARNQADAAVMGLELESARQAKQSLLSSFSRNGRSFDTEIFFEDSPAKSQMWPGPPDPPTTPRTLHLNLSRQLKAATARAEDAELALTALEGEVRSLGFNATTNSSAMGSLSNLADHFRSIRLELERLMPGETEISFNNSELFPEIMRKIKNLFSQLRSRETELKSLRSQERTLKGNFDHALVAAGKADVKIKDLEKALDEMAAESMETRMRAQEYERQRDEKGRDVERLQVALGKYRDEVGRLEELIEKVESEHKDAMQKVKEESGAAWEKVEEMEAKVAAEETGRRKVEESSVSRLKRIQDLEQALSQAREDAEQVQDQLKQVEQRESNRSEEIGDLNSRISSLSSALASADAEIEKLKQVNSRLELQYRNEVAQGEKAVSRMHEELIKAATRITEAGKGYRRGSKVRLANWELEPDDLPTDESGAPLTPASIVRFADYAEVEVSADEGDDDSSDHVPGSVEIGRGKLRRSRTLTPEMSITRMKGKRRYDSGIGMSPSVETDGEASDSGIETPELSSEGDIDMHDDANVEVY
jgi:chromosome segregation ATPase